MKQPKQTTRIRPRRRTREHKKLGIRLRTGIKAGSWDTAAYGDKPY